MNILILNSFRFTGKMKPQYRKFFIYFIPHSPIIIITNFLREEAGRGQREREGKNLKQAPHPEWN